MELSNADKEYQNKSMELGFSDETTSASSINNGKTNNDTRAFLKRNQVHQIKRIRFQNFKEEIWLFLFCMKNC